MIEQARDGDVTVIRLAHPPANALDLELLEALSLALDDAEASDAAALVLTGDGSVFSAGADLYRVLEEGSAYLERAGAAFAGALERLFLFPRPVVAAIGGHAIAGGCVLACACDHRVAATGDVRIGLAELRVGVPFPAWALEIVRFSLAPPHLQRLAYTGRLCRPHEALAAGLVDEIVTPEELMARAAAAARGLARVPPVTYALTKRALREPAADRARRAGALDDEIRRAWASGEVRAAIERFLVKTFGSASRGGDGRS